MNTWFVTKTGLNYSKTTLNITLMTLFVLEAVTIFNYIYIIFNYKKLNTNK